MYKLAIAQLEFAILCPWFVLTGQNKKKKKNLENESFESSRTYIKMNYIDENPD